MKKPILHDLLELEIQDLYDAEQQLVEALPKMAEAAQDDQLRQGFEKHLRQTEEHVKRLEQASAELDLKLGQESCEGMEGLISEGEEMIELSLDPIVADLALISAAQKVEHYEIAGYGTTITLAEEMGHTKTAKLLKKTIDEEEKTDKELTRIAEDLMKRIKE